MTNSNSDNPLSEFDIIAKIFAPLSAGAPGAFGLKDDAATLSPPPGEELIVTADLLTEGIHFLQGDPPDLIARKALRTNLSDLAGKGATPLGYLLSLALPSHVDLAWLKLFASGLANDQDEFPLSLLGGDTTVTTGSLTIAISAFGSAPIGQMIRRAGATVGDLVFVSGTIGDAGLGLAVLRDGISGGALSDRNSLACRYRVPIPRLALGRALRGIATAALDVSDGLLADLGHIADVSMIRVVLDASRIPLSESLVAVAGSSVQSVLSAVAAGDDYEIAFTAPVSARDEVQKIAARTKTPVTEIGHVEAGAGVALMDSAGAEIPVSRRGYSHF